MKLAVLLPCYNEEAAIAQTVAGFRTVLPDADIYVYDNNSTDRSEEHTSELQSPFHISYAVFCLATFGRGGGSRLHGRCSGLLQR